MKKIRIIVFLLASWSTGSAQNTFPTPSGNVGIGTTSPSTLLQLRKDIGIAMSASYTYSNDISGIRFSNLSTASNAGIALNFQLGATGTSHAAIAASRPSDDHNILHFYTEHANTIAERMRINSNGNVGIGTLTPGSRLNVGTRTTNSPSSIAQFGDYVPDGEARVLSLVNSGGGTDQSTSIDFHNRSNWSPTGKIQVQQRSTYTQSKLHFYTYNSGLKNRMTIDHNGYVGIGTPDPKSRLSVNGQIRATEVKVLSDISVPDYVFEADYNLRSLKETKDFIVANKHLPEIPSASEIGENGIDLGEMNMKLLKKIEELTLHLIKQNEKLEAQQLRIEKLEKQK